MGKEADRNTKSLGTLHDVFVTNSEFSSHSGFWSTMKLFCCSCQGEWLSVVFSILGGISILGIHLWFLHNGNFGHKAQVDFLFLYTFILIINMGIFASCHLFGRLPLIRYILFMFDGFAIGNCLVLDNLFLMLLDAHRTKTEFTLSPKSFSTIFKKTQWIYFLVALALQYFSCRKYKDFAISLINQGQGRFPGITTHTMMPYLAVPLVFRFIYYVLTFQFQEIFLFYTLCFTTFLVQVGGKHFSNDMETLDIVHGISHIFSSIWCNFCAYSAHLKTSKISGSLDTSAMAANITNIYFFNFAAWAILIFFAFKLNKEAKHHHSKTE